MNIWNDKWLRNVVLQRDMYENPDLPQKVAELIKDDRSDWQLDKVRDVLTDE